MSSMNKGIGLGYVTIANAAAGIATFTFVFVK
jgi:hypothetical protein